jgi:pectinesterase
MPHLALAALLISLSLPAFAPFAFGSDVHVRVDPSAPLASPGNEDRTVFPTIQNALDHHPFATDGGRVFIQIVPGTYRERLFITQNHPNITLLGLGKSPSDVVITNSLNASQAGGTFFTATVQIESPGFEADNLTIENAAGNTGQAVAVANRSDRSIFKHCRLLGHQDTLFADFGRQYYLDTFIEGATDYIFGNAAAVFDRDELHSNGPGYITAQSRTSATQPTGFVILNSRVTAALDPAARQTIYLGRPWRPFARVVFIHTDLPASLNPAGWNNWSNPANESTAFFAESDSTSPSAVTGASPSTRVSWSHQLTSAQAAPFLPAAFLAGPDRWDPIAAAAQLP